MKSCGFPTVACFSRRDGQHGLQARIVTPPSPLRIDRLLARNALQATPCRQRRLLSTGHGRLHGAWGRFAAIDFKLPQGNFAARPGWTAEYPSMARSSTLTAMHSRSTLMQIKKQIAILIKVRRLAKISAEEQSAGPRRGAMRARDDAQGKTLPTQTIRFPVSQIE